MQKGIMFRWFFFHSAVLMYFSVLMMASASADSLAGTFIDGGSCEVTEQSPGIWSIATPNNDASAKPRSVTVKEEDLSGRVEALVTRELKKTGIENFPAANYEVHVECSAAHIRLAINVPGESGAPGLCARTDLAAKELKLLSNNESQSGLSCQGERPLHLLLGAANPAALPAVLAQLKSAPYAETMVESGKIEGDHMVVVQLKKDLMFRESSARALIASDSGLSNLLEYVDYDRMNDVVGASQPLFTARYQGF